MTVSAVVPRVVYTGNGAGPSEFAVANDGQPILFNANSEIFVAYQDDVGTITVLEEGTHYDLAGGPDAGIVTRLAGALPNDTKLAIWREIDISQDTDLVDTGDFSSESVEQGLDYRARVDQDLYELASRALKTDVFDSTYDAGSRRITNLAPATAATDAVTFQQLVDSYTGDLDLTASVTGFTASDGVPGVTDVQAAIELLGNRTRGAANTLLANPSASTANMAPTAKGDLSSVLTPAANDVLVGYTEAGLLRAFPIGNLPSSAGAVPVGGIMAYGALAAPSGWVRLNGRTIGSASSGGTERANADCQALHEFIWTHYPDLLVGSTSFTTTADPTLNSNTSAAGASFRYRIPASAISTSGRFIRLTLTPPTTGSNTVISNLYIGHIGSVAPSFDGFQERVTFSGNNNITLTAGGSSVVSDAIEFALDEARDIIVAFDCSASDFRFNAAATGYTQYSKATTGEYYFTTVSGYTAASGFLGVIDKLEVLTGSRGASAAADWAANKAIELPDARFRSIFGFDGMGNSAAGRATGITSTGDAPGTTGGKGRRFIDLAELPNYTPSITITDPGHNHPERTADGSSGISAGSSKGAVDGTTGNAFTGISAALATSINGSNTQAQNPNMPGYLLASIIMKL